MTEREWLSSSDPTAMLAALAGAGRPRGWGRKLRLWACAVCRAVWPLLTDPRSRHAVGVAERYADGEATAEEVAGVLGTECHFPRTFADTFAWGCVGWQAPVIAGAWAAVIGDGHANQTFLSVVRPVDRPVPGPQGPGGLSLSHPDGGGEDLLVTGGLGAALLRDVVGDPFRPASAASTPCPHCRGRGEAVVPDPPGIHSSFRPKTEPCRYCRRGKVPAPRPWITPAVLALAGAAHDGDAAALAVLPDALEEAGCGDEEILRHLRGPGPHVKGCWCVDLLLGKE